MSKLTTPASSQINGHDSITIELVETDTHPAVVIITWPAKSTVIHLRRFPDAAAAAAKLFAEAATRLAGIRKDRKL